MAGSPPAGMVAGRLAAAAAARAGLGERAAPGAGRTVAAVLGDCVLREFLRAGHAGARASGLAGTRTARNALACRRLRRALRHLPLRSEEHTSELQSLMRISYAVFCLKKKNK